MAVSRLVSCQGREDTVSATLPPAGRRPKGATPALSFQLGCTIAVQVEGCFKDKRFQTWLNISISLALPYQTLHTSAGDPHELHRSASPRVQHVQWVGTLGTRVVQDTRVRTRHGLRRTHEIASQRPRIAAHETTSRQTIALPTR